MRPCTLSVLLALVLTAIAAAQNFNDKDAVLGSWTESGRSVDIAAANDGTLVAAYIVRHVDPKKIDALVVTVSRDDGLTWREVYRGDDTWQRRLRSLSVEVASGFPGLSGDDRRVFVVVQGIDTLGGRTTATVRVMSGPLDAPWSFSIWPPSPLNFKADVPLGRIGFPSDPTEAMNPTIDVIPYRSGRVVDYAVGIGFAYSTSAGRHIYVARSIDHGRTFSVDNVTGGRTYHRSDYAMPCFSVDRATGDSWIAFEDTKNETVRVFTCSPTEFLIGGPFRPHSVTPYGDPREFAPRIAAEHGRFALTCLTSRFGRCGGVELCWFRLYQGRMYRVYHAIDTDAFSEADIVVREGKVFITAVIAGDCNRGRGYPEVWGFQGDISSASPLEAYRINEVAVIQTRPRVATSSGGWWSGAYAYCVLDIWNAYLGATVHVDLAR